MSEPADRIAADDSDIFSKIVPNDARTATFDLLFFNLKHQWELPFWLMLLLSAAIATLGLSENSAAVVIGAMIVAPLGQPIIALGASLALGWGWQTVRMLGLITVGALSVIAVGYAFGAILPLATPNDQMLARTAPDLRDLGIALFAGAAGAYGYYRSEYSTVLAGVAIAVALVPPLCTVGLMFQAGHLILAKGALILFLTNLIGITVATIVTFFGSGAAQSGPRRRWFIGGTFATLLAGGAILVPLTLNYDVVAEGTDFQKELFETASASLKTIPGKPVLTGVKINGGEAIISLKPLPTSSIEQQQIINDIQKVSSFQITLAETK